VACSQNAYRERQSIKKEEEAFQAEQDALHEEQRNFLGQKKAEADRLFAEQQAKQEIINKEIRERELKLKLEHEQKQERLRKIKADKRAKAKKNDDLKANLYYFGGLAVIGAMNYLSETMQKLPQTSEIRPLTDNLEPESPA
jgi:hypothetical protein